MNWKNEKGYTGVDIAIAVVVLFIFVSLIATLSYRINSSSKEIELKSKATEIAVDEIEAIKNKSWENITTDDISILEPIEVEEGYYKTIMVQDYQEMNPSAISDLVKKITVQIQYRFKNKQHVVELSTIMTKES